MVDAPTKAWSRLVLKYWFIDEAATGFQLNTLAEQLTPANLLSNNSSLHLSARPSGTETDVDVVESRRLAYRNEKHPRSRWDLSSASEAPDRPKRRSSRARGSYTGGARSQASSIGSIAERLHSNSGITFTIGTSSDEDEDSPEIRMLRRSLSKSFRRLNTKQTSFKEEVTVGRAATQESDNEDEDISEGAIEDDDDSSDWEDSDDASGPSSANGTELFQRVDSRPNLTSRRSLLNEDHYFGGVTYKRNIRDCEDHINMQLVQENYMQHVEEILLWPDNQISRRNSFGDFRTLRRYESAKGAKAPRHFASHPDGALRFSYEHSHAS